MINMGSSLKRQQVNTGLCPTQMESQVKVWNLEKRDGGNPLCTRIFPAIPGNKPTVVSCITVHENLNFMAIGTCPARCCVCVGDPTLSHSCRCLGARG
ncbi:hypothetical protein FKM82_028827, partial [Ascaphus truei]